MNIRSLILALALASSLHAHHQPTWSTIEEGEADQAAAELPILKEWRELSRKALKAEKRQPRNTEADRQFNRKADESSSTVDCGLVCALPKAGIRVEAKIHYFFEGNDPPKDLGNSIAITFNITGSESWRHFAMSSLEPSIITKKGSIYRPKTDGMGSIDQEEWSYSLLAILEEVDCRRLLAEDFDKVNLGPIIITRSDLVRQGLKELFRDLDERRKDALGE